MSASSRISQHLDKSQDHPKRNEGRPAFIPGISDPLPSARRTLSRRSFTPTSATNVDLDPSATNPFDLLECPTRIATRQIRFLPLSARLPRLQYERP